jgi:hypothetical protein
MSEQIPNRIEAYCDLSRFVFLREFDGPMPRTASNKYDHHSPVVVAEEFDGDGHVVRSWFIMLKPNRDGFGLTAACQPHRIVSRDIRPGATPAYDPNDEAQIVQQYDESYLINIRSARDEMLADRERHLIYSQSYLDALHRAKESQSEVERLQGELSEQTTAHSAELQKRDAELFELKNETELNRLQIATLQASYAKLWEQKGLRERVKVWFRTKLKRLECALRRAASSVCCAEKCKSATGRNSWRVWFRR